MLMLLKKGAWPDSGENFVQRHLNPQPRLALGRALAQASCVTSMIDVSDGLLLDLGRITVDKGLGARINADSIPTSEGYKEIASEYTEDIYQLPLSGGEDYELLFTSEQQHKDEVLKIANDTGTEVTEIGIVTASQRIEIIDLDGNEINLKQRGFVHFN